MRWPLSNELMWYSGGFVKATINSSKFSFSRSSLRISSSKSLILSARFCNRIGSTFCFRGSGSGTSMLTLGGALEGSAGSRKTQVPAAKPTAMRAKTQNKFLYLGWESLLTAVLSRGFCFLWPHRDQFSARRFLKRTRTGRGNLSRCSRASETSVVPIRAQHFSSNKPFLLHILLKSARMHSSARFSTPWEALGDELDRLLGGRDHPLLGLRSSLVLCLLRTRVRKPATTMRRIRKPCLSAHW